MSSVKKFLKKVSEQRLGYNFAPPRRLGKDSLAVIVPITRKTSLKRQYVLLTENPEVKIVDTGNIHQFLVKNPSKENVYICAGTVFKGPTQERALVRSAVIFAGKEQTVEVRCVHASKGINRGSEVIYGGYTPLHMDQNTYGKGFTPKDQSTYWNSVKSYSTSVLAAGLANVAQPQNEWNAVRSASGMLGGSNWLSEYTEARQLASTTTDLVSTSPPSGSEPDDLASIQDQVGNNLDEIIRQIELVPDQTGLAFLSDKGLQTVALFDVHESWATLHKDAVKRLGPSLAAKDEQGVFDYRQDMAHSTVAAVLGQDYDVSTIYEHRSSNGEPPLKICGLTSENFLGETVEIGGFVVHVVINRILVVA